MNRSAAWSLIAAMGSFAFVAAGATNTFEEAESTKLGECPTGWTGYCAVSNQVGAYETTPPGTPVLTADATHARVLWVEGSAAREYAESGNRVVDLLVMAEEWPDEELPAADGNEQIKFAFDTNGCVNLYHKLASDDAAAQWRVVSSDAIPAGTWVRTTFTFDYDHNLCQLKLNGSPCVSEYGYRSPDNLTHPGSWYYMAKSGASSLASIDFVGCGGVDDVINAAKDAYTPAHSGPTATDDGVDYAWFDKNGLAWSDGSVAAPGGSGYTLKESFQAGTDPCSSNKLYVTNASYDASHLVLTFNGCDKTYHVETKNSPFTDGTAGTDVTSTGNFTSDSAANTTTWTGPFPTTEDLTYYRVRSTDALTAETVNQFAIMKITSSATNTLFALPWNSLSADTNSPTAITVANVVMTQNLVNGDYLLYYDNEEYKGWILANGAWTPILSATDIGTITATTATATSLVRGQAMWLIRCGGTNRDLSQPFYLYGQYQEASGSIVVDAKGALLANPVATIAFDLSSGKITGMAQGDVIRVPPVAENALPVFYTYTNSSGSAAWTFDKVESTTQGGKTMTTHTPCTSGDFMKIPAGRGFLYKSPTGATPTINW